MATTVTQVVTIKGLTRYGFQMADGRFCNWSKGTKQEDKDKVVPGAAFEMELYVSDKGAHYVNSIGKQVSAGEAPPVTETKMVHTKTAVTNAVVSGGRDFDKEARGKTRCALLQGFLANPSLDLSNVKEALPMIDLLVGYVFGDK